ncbi:hypothetical protein EON64_07475 [archaeon]|nr:MAG: hypothetical protein EON64_07475 [archaeon]
MSLMYMSPLASEEELQYTEAILGTSIMADTLEGKMEVKVPQGVQPDQLLRLRGKGVPSSSSSEARGDIYIKLKVGYLIHHTLLTVS